MVFGYSTNAFVKFSLFESIERIANLGFKGVEIMGDRPHLYPPDFGPDEIERLKTALKVHQLKVTNLNSFTLFAVGDTYLPSFIEPDKARREIRIRHTRESLKAAKALGCRNISIPPGGPLEDMDWPNGAALFREGLEQVIPDAEALGVKLLIEPEPELLIENSEQFKTFIKDFQSEALGLNFDIGHFFCVGEDPGKALEDLFEWIGHMHLEDIAATRVHNHLIPGLGVIDYPAIFKTIKQLGYTGDISLELYPYVDTPEEAGKESLAFLKPVFEASGLDVE
jgi:sugar phosphate isomerase/epimerase